MIEKRIQLDPRQVRRVRRAYDDVAEALPKAVDRAIPVAGRKARVATVKALAANVNITQRKLYQKGNRRRPVRDAVFTEGGRRGYRLTLDKGRIPLGRFAPRQHWRKGETQGRVRTRVSYKVRKDGGRAKIGDAFAITFESGYTGIFRRANDARLPLRELYGPSVPEVGEKDAAVQRVMDVQAGEDLIAETESRLDFILSRA